MPYVFHNLEPQNPGLVDVKRDLHEKGILVRENLKKKSMVIKNVIWCDKSLMHKAEGPSNYFFQFFHI